LVGPRHLPLTPRQVFWASRHDAKTRSIFEQTISLRREKNAASFHRTASRGDTMTAALSFRPAALVFSAAMAITALVSSPATAEAADSSPDVSLRIITFGETRQQLQATPIEQRPYRPLHFYGNRVRRQSRRSTTSSTNTRTRATPTSNSSRSR